MADCTTGRMACALAMGAGALVRVLALVLVLVLPSWPGLGAIRISS